MAEQKFKRVALEPNRSLGCWIEHMQTVHNPSGTDGRRLKVTDDLLRQHCTEQDLWIVLNGKVYNVTHYLAYHPGGKDSLLSAAGKDATKLFNEYHPWVNFDSMLSRCCVGYYVGKKTL